MLQPRLLLRHPKTSCNHFLFTTSPRTYATATATPSAARIETSNPVTLAAAPPPIRDEGGSGIRRYKPKTPGIRHLRRPINDHLWKGRAHLPLTFAKKGQAKGGRNSSGKITVRHRGGGAKRRIRMVDFSRTEPGRHVVERIEHDPGRSAHIALLNAEETGKKSYIVAAEGMRAGDTVQSYMKGIPKDLLQSMGGVIDPGVLAAQTAWRGNCLPLHMMPIGTLIFNVGSAKDRGGVFCRSAGTFATVVSKDVTTTDRVGKWVTVRLQSGEVRRVSKDACATVGVASNANYQYRQLGKAGRKRWLGIRPTVRGVAMNSADHPHGGGRGKSKGNVHPVSPWGLPAKSGYRTRSPRKPNKWIVEHRPRNQGKRRRANK